MKRIIPLVILGIALALLAQNFTFDGRVTLEFDYPTNELKRTTFRIFHSTDATLNVSNWVLLTTFTGTNRVRLTLPTPENYFVCVASNFWTESDRSNVASTPPFPPPTTLSIRKGHN